MLVPLGDTILPVKNSVKEFQPFWGLDPHKLERLTTEEWSMLSHRQWVYICIDVFIVHNMGHGARKCLLLIHMSDQNSSDFFTKILGIAKMGPLHSKLLSYTLCSGDVSENFH